MRFINCGALNTSGQRFPTKKALREALSTDPSTVFFDTTSPYDRTGRICGSSIPDDATLTVVGPDPFRNRSWYCSVKKQPDGRIKVA